MTSHSRTINLTRIKEGNYYDSILSRKFDYDTEVKERKDVKQEFSSQKLVAEKLYHEKSAELISAAVEGVKDFVTKSMNLKGTNLFDKTEGQIHGEVLHLDMQLSDHEMTYTFIEKAVKKLVNNLHIIRLKANQARKRSISELMEPTRQSRRIFLIVEQTECLSRVLTETLVGLLKNRLSDETSPTDTIMILFCLSLRIKALPFDNLHCFGRMKGIHKQTDQSKVGYLEILLRSRGLKVKLGPNVLDFIYEHSLHTDSSITNVKYLHCYAIFEHYQRLNAESLISQAEYEELESQHQLLCDNILSLSLFLKDKDKWPTDATDLYSELESYSDLSKSHDFFDSLQSLRKISHDRLVKRFENVENQFGNLVTKSKKVVKQNAVSILSSYKDKIGNNRDCDEILLQLINDLMKYAKNIRSPFNEQRNFYFNNVRSLETGCFTASRRAEELSETYLNESSYFGILFKRILNSPGNIAAAELCDEVLEDFKKLITIQESTTEKRQDPVETKRSRRKTTIRASRKSMGRETSEEERDGLARAIFVDMIDSMEHQGIVKLDARAKGKVIKRLAWPAMDSLQ